MEYTLIVEPLIQLNEKEAELNEPVPPASTPYTVDVPPEEAPELSTVNTEVRTLEVTVEVPAKTIPLSV